MTSDFDPTTLSDLSDDELTAQVCGYAAQVAASTARFVLLVAEFDRRGGWDGEGIRSCAHWLNWRVGLSIGAAREHVRVGHALAELPLVRQCFIEGELSYSKVRALTRAATPATEESLVRIARLTMASQLERICSAFRGACEEDQRVNAVMNHEPERRIVNSWTTRHDSVVIFAELPLDEGAVVLAGLEATGMALRAERQEERQTAKDAAKAAREAAKAAKAAAEEGRDVPAGTSQDPDEPSEDVPAGTLEDPRPALTRADALVAMAASALAQRPKHVEGTESTRVVVHIDDRVRQDPTAEGCCHIDRVGAVPIELAERLACDASVRTVRYTEGGIELSAPTREIPERMRRALRLRDGQCRFPGCPAHGRLHAHHVVFASRGGTTTMDNLCLLCSYHHHLVHEGGFHLSMSKAGDVMVWAPDGRRLPDRPVRITPVGPPPAASDMPYCGESFDLHWVVDGLCIEEFHNSKLEPPDADDGHAEAA